MEKQCFLYHNCNHFDCGRDFCIRKYKTDTLYFMALLTDAQRSHVVLRVDQDGTDLEEFKKLAAIEQSIDSFVQEGRNLYLHSPNCGNGKSTWAVRLLEAYFNKIWARSDLRCRALFISVPRLLLALKDNISVKSDYVAYIKEHINEADVVVWDDIAAKVGSDFELNHLLAMIEGRLILGKSNIYTSNLNARELTLALGERIASRIANLSTDIELRGADKRFLKFNGAEGK